MRLMERPKKKKLNQRIQILHKFHLGSASCMCRNEEIYPFRLRNGPRIVFLAFHGDMPKKRKPRKRGFPGLYHYFKISSSSAAISVLRTSGQKIRSTGLLATLLVGCGCFLSAYCRRGVFFKMTWILFCVSFDQNNMPSLEYFCIFVYEVFSL